MNGDIWIALDGFETAVERPGEALEAAEQALKSSRERTNRLELCVLVLKNLVAATEKKS